MFKLRLASFAVMILILSSVSAHAQRMQISIENFDQWIFQEAGGAAQARTTLQSKVELEILRIEQSTPLTESQKERIRLAGRGDIKRFFDRVDQAHRDFRALGENLNQNNINEAHQLTVPLQQDLSRGLFGRESLLYKVIQSSFDKRESAVMRRENERRKLAKCENAVKVYVAQLGRQIPMTAAQRESLVKLGLEKVKSIDMESQYSTYLVRYRLSQILSDEFKAIFNEAQFEALDRSLQQAKGWEQMLELQGMLDDD